MDKPEQQTRLLAIGKLSAGIIHDLRGPLTIIKGFSDYVTASPICRNDPQVVATATLVKRAVAKIDYFTNQLLHSPSIGADHQTQRFNIVEVIDRSLEMLTSKVANYQISIDRQLPDNYQISGRPEQIEQVFSNIISNSCDAVQGLPERTVTVRLVEDGNQLQVSVADTGNGVDEELRAKVFTTFFTTKEKGVGLGLAIAEEIIASHHGQITITDNRPHGAIFTVTLPSDRR